MLLDERFRGMSAERIYNLLEEELGDENQNSSENESQKGGESQTNTDSKPGESGDEDGLSAPQTPVGIGQVLDAAEPSEGHRRASPRLEDRREAGQKRGKSGWKDANGCQA